MWAWLARRPRGSPEWRSAPERDVWSRSGSLRGPGEGHAHPSGVSTASPRLRSHHDHVQGEHLLSGL